MAACRWPRDRGLPRDLPGFAAEAEIRDGDDNDGEQGHINDIIDFRHVAKGASLSI